MTLWQVVLFASVACLVLKLAGYLVPSAVLEKPAAARTANLVTVALLAALIAVQTLGAGTGLVLDARVPAVAFAALLFAIRVPFVVVVAAAAGAAGLLRALDWAV